MFAPHLPAFGRFLCRACPPFTRRSFARQEDRRYEKYLDNMKAILSTVMILEKSLTETVI